VFAEVPQQDKPQAGFYLQRLSVEDIDQRRLSGKLTETTVVKRSLYPQALFAELVAGTDYQADRVISQSDLQDDFFAHREVRINLLSDELDDNVQLVMVRLRYGPDNKQYTFRQGDTKPKIFRSPSIIDPQTGKMLWPVEYDFTVYLNQAVGGVRSVSSGALQTELNDVYLDIESLYGRYDFVIKAANLFDWRWYLSVLVTLRCRPIGQTASSLSKSFQISQTAQQDSYPVMLPNPDQYLFDVTKEYSSAANSPHISAVLTEPTSQDVYLPSSLYHQRVLMLSASMDWQQVESVMVSASYAYLPGDDTPPLQQIFQFTETEAAPQRFSADQIDPERLAVDLEIWFSYLPGQDGDKPKYVQTATNQDAIDIANLN
jgi:hypothetical protein